MKVNNKKHKYISVSNTIIGLVYGTMDGSGYLLKVDNLNKLVTSNAYAIFVNLETGILVTRTKDDQLIDLCFSDINLV